MKSKLDSLRDNNPKNIEKITKACEKGNCSQYVSSFLSEIASTSINDFPKLKMVVTSSYICSYEYFGGITAGILTIIPINQVVNLYRTNIDPQNSYNYQCFYLAIELNNGQRAVISSQLRNKKTFETLYSDVVTLIRSRISNMGV